MTGLVVAWPNNDRITEAARLSTECVALIESIGDPTLAAGLIPANLHAKFQACEAVETLRLTDRVITFADGDPTMGDLVIGSPLAIALVFRGAAEMSLGSPGFREHFDAGVAIARGVDPTSFALATMFKYASLPMGAYLADDAALRETADALEIAEKSGDPLTLAAALMARGVTLFNRRGPERDEGYRLLSKLQELAVAEQLGQIVDIHTAILKFGRPASMAPSSWPGPSRATCTPRARCIGVNWRSEHWLKR